ncbi:MAG: tRNA epoxyqueuosine(34) reductase QueG, partial [Bryobacteraceae bacterium]
HGAIEHRLAGFELAGIASTSPSADWNIYSDWVASGMAGEMDYLTDHRAQLRADPRSLLPSAKSILCVGKLYHNQADNTHISRYAQGLDYHDVLRAGLEKVVTGLRICNEPFDYRICVDTAPFLERSYARQAGLGWIGRNTCLINQQSGSWYFLGELLLSFDLAPDNPAPDRCGTCTRCIDACPTTALVPGGHGYQLDSRLCISYLTIELRNMVPEALRKHVNTHVFGCDICQDVCPWNSRAPFTADPAFGTMSDLQGLSQMAEITPQKFRDEYRHTPLWRTKHSGFLRNVAIAMGNSGDAGLVPALERLSANEDSSVAGHAQFAWNNWRNLAPLQLPLIAGLLYSQTIRGFEHFYNLEYADAIGEFQQMIAREPSNANAYNHLSQAVLYREMYKAGALESELVSGTNPFLRREKISTSPQATRQFTEAIAASMRLSQARLAGNPNDTQALYTLGVAHGLRANYKFLVQKAWMDSLKDATTSRKLHNQVVDLIRSWWRRGSSKVSTTMWLVACPGIQNAWISRRGSWGSRGRYAHSKAGVGEWKSRSLRCTGPLSRHLSPRA